MKLQNTGNLLTADECSVKERVEGTTEHKGRVVVVVRVGGGAGYEAPFYHTSSVSHEIMSVIY